MGSPLPIFISDSLWITSKELKKSSKQFIVQINNDNKSEINNYIYNVPISSMESIDTIIRIVGKINEEIKKGKEVIIYDKSMNYSFGTIKDLPVGTVFEILVLYFTKCKY